MKYTPTKSEIRKYIIRQVRERPGVIFVDELNFIEKDLEKLEKLEKAIEIIKEKKVDPHWLLVCLQGKNPFETYNGGYTKVLQLTQEEFDLLKEVFANDKEENQGFN